MNKKVATAPVDGTDQFNFKGQKILWNFYLFLEDRDINFNIEFMEPKGILKKVPELFWIFYRSYPSKIIIHTATDNNGLLKLLLIYFMIMQ